jgi:hypothetical protein
LIEHLQRRIAASQRSAAPPQQITQESARRD